VTLGNPEHFGDCVRQWLDALSCFAENAGSLYDVRAEGLEPSAGSIYLGLERCDPGVKGFFLTIVQVCCVDDVSNLGKVVTDFLFGDSIESDRISSVAPSLRDSRTRYVSVDVRDKVSKRFLGNIREP
jgi:hypothetical protein